MDGLGCTDRTFVIKHQQQREVDDSAICALAMAARCEYEHALAATFQDHLAPAGTTIVRMTWRCNHHMVRRGAEELFLSPARTLRATTHWDMVRGHSMVRVEKIGDAHAWHWVWLDRGRFVHDPLLTEAVSLEKYKQYPIAAIRLMVL